MKWDKYITPKMTKKEMRTVHYRPRKPGILSKVYKSLRTWLSNRFSW